MTTLSPLARSTLAALSTAALTACPAVPVRPEPPTCSKAAIEAMDKLGINIGDLYGIYLMAEARGYAGPVELGTGPIVSSVASDAHLDPPYAVPEGTRLFGQVLPSPGNAIHIRYTELQIPPGERVPICAVARVAKEPGNPEEFVAFHNLVEVRWVFAFPK